MWAFAWLHVIQGSLITAGLGVPSNKKTADGVYKCIVFNRIKLHSFKSPIWIRKIIADHF